jgi:hypothetical protein
MRGAIPLLPNTYLHDINSNNFIFTVTVLFASSPCPESTKLSILSVRVFFFTGVTTPSTVHTINTVTAFIKETLHYKQSVLQKHNYCSIKIQHCSTNGSNVTLKQCGTIYECHINTHDTTYYSELHLRI